MKLPSTKLNLGDSLWSMSGNKPTEWIVESIRCFVTNKSCSISYELHKSDNPVYKRMTDECSIGYDCFKSKQELMANLFGDCLTERLVVK